MSWSPLVGYRTASTCQIASLNRRSSRARSSCHGPIAGKITSNGPTHRAHAVDVRDARAAHREPLLVAVAGELHLDDRVDRGARGPRGITARALRPGSSHDRGTHADRARSDGRP